MRGIVLGALLGILLAGCQESRDPKVVLGHWRAENVRVQGLGVPLGPEIDISETEVAVTGTDIRVPIQGMQRDGNEITLTFPLGVSLSFMIDAPDRMSVDIPLVGAVVYRREPSPATVSGTPASPTNAAGSVGAPSPKPAAITADGAPAPEPPSPQALLRDARTMLAQGQLAGAEDALDRAAAIVPADPSVLVERAVVALARSDADSAVRQVEAALRHGFRPAHQLAADPRLQGLRDDARFKALIARYQ